MKKITSFIFGTIVGSAAGFLAGSLLVTDNQIEELKKKVKNNETVKDLKKKYDNGTEVVKNQLASFPKSVEDDSELKDFDDIVIDNSKDDDPLQADNVENSVKDLHDAEEPNDAPHPQGPAKPKDIHHTEDSAENDPLSRP